MDTITVFVDSDFAVDPVTRKSTPGLVAQVGGHTLKAGSTLQTLTALGVGEGAELQAVVKESQVGLSLRSIYTDSGIPVTVDTKWHFHGKLFDRSFL